MFVSGIGRDVATNAIVQCQLFLIDSLYCTCLTLQDCGLKYVDGISGLLNSVVFNILIHS